MHRHIDLSRQQSLLNLLNEQSLGSRLGERKARLCVAAGLDDSDFNKKARRRKMIPDPAGLP